jgi:HlyD family secretion protein
VRRLVRWLAVPALALAAWAVWALAPAADAVSWAPVQRGDLPLTVQVVGQLKAEESIFLGPPTIEAMWDYKVAFLAPEGTEVAAGDPVIGFDASELERQREERATEAAEVATELDKRSAQLGKEEQALELQVAEKEAELAKLRLQTQVPPELEAALERDKKRLDRTLAERELAQLRQTRSFNAAQARAELASLRDRQLRAAARVAELEAAIARLTVRAPRAGTVIYAGGDFEDKVKLGDSVWMGRQVIELPTLTRLFAEAQVDEADVGKLAAGQPSRLTLDAFPDLALAGRLREIGNSVDRPRMGSTVKVVRVALALEPVAGARLRPGMRFRGTVETGALAGVLLVPSAAVEWAASGPRAWRKTRFGAAPVALELGRWGQDRVEVRQGLAEGDQVRLGGGASR